MSIFVQNIITMVTLNDFLFVYFYQLESELNADCKDLATLKFQSEEANTDEEVKLFFKKYISSNQTIKKGAIQKLIIARNEKQQEANIEDLLKYKIAKVLLPNELTNAMKIEIAASKKSVYTNPDLYMQVNDGNGKTVYVSIELKTTKNNQIPGSSVQQVSPFEWVIFVKHTEGGEVDVTCGFYINSITEKLPFPDRSPRPLIGFDTLKKWNKTNRKVNNGILKYTISEEEEQNKAKILDNWEQVLCDEWLETIMKDSRKSEKWFNNTIRMYTLQLLNKVKDNPNLLDKLIEKLSHNIKG